MAQARMIQARILERDTHGTVRQKVEMVEKEPPRRISKGE